MTFLIIRQEGLTLWTGSEHERPYAALLGSRAPAASPATPSYKLTWKDKTGVNSLSDLTMINVFDVLALREQNTKDKKTITFSAQKSAHWLPTACSRLKIICPVRGIENTADVYWTGMA